jgi:hypothetical protein
METSDHDVNYTIQMFFVVLFLFFFMNGVMCNEGHPYVVSTVCGGGGRGALSLCILGHVFGRLARIKIKN